MILLQAKPVNLEVFYEALCSDSVNFVQKQLSPVYDKLNKFLNVTFIPFGQGKVIYIYFKIYFPTNISYTSTYIPDLFQITKLSNGNYSLECHRPKECEADQVHACAIEYIKETDKLLKFVNCSLVEGFQTNVVPLEKVLELKSSLQFKSCVNFIVMNFFLYI